MVFCVMRPSGAVTVARMSTRSPTCTSPAAVNGSVVGKETSSCPGDATTALDDAPAGPATKFAQDRGSSRHRYGQTLPDESTRVGQCPGRHEVQGVASALERVLRDRCIRGDRDTCDDQLLPRPKVALLRVRAKRCVEQKTCD